MTRFLTLLGDLSTLQCNVFIARDGRHALLAASFAPRPPTLAMSYWTNDACHDSDASPSSESDPELDTVVPRRCQRFFAVTREGRPDPAARAFLYSTTQRGDLFAFGHFVVEACIHCHATCHADSLTAAHRAAVHRDRALRE